LKYSFKIGNVEIKNPIIVAPMAGITNTSFRKICKKMGASLVVAEMVSDKAIVYGSSKTFDLLKMSDNERPISQQIFGSDVSSFVAAAKKVEEYMHPDIIDINMGCPVPKVAIKAQAGSALLKNPEKIKEIVASVVKAVNVPVTVKIRSGWDDHSINAPEVAKICEEAGASAIAIHARTRAQGYTGVADWSIIKKVKENVSIPVIGNGDVKSCFDAKKMLEETGCDGVMIGRGILGNPWLIKECVDYLEDGTLPKNISFEEKISMMKKHLELLYADKDEREATLELRSILMYYLKGLPNTHDTKLLICKSNSKEEYLDIINNYQNSYKNGN
jgi:tRNA-dihydrouridine synthase B